MSVIPETANVRTITLKPVNGKVFDYKPGQFAFVKFFSKGLSREEHHFTLSSVPNAETISFSIKESGDYTSELGKVRKGDKAKVDGPYGVFTNLGMQGPYLFIVGGIGITPVISMLRSNSNLNDSVLVYANKSANEAAFKSEIEKMNVKTYWVYSPDHIDDRVLSQVKDIKKRKIFLVGPEGLMRAVKKILQGMGIDKTNIFTEKFALR